MSVSWSLDSILEGIMEWGVKKGILHAGERIGQYGIPFKMYKIKTMKENSDLNPPKNFFDPPSNEMLLWYGPFLRSTGIDELPQLYNVYKKEMTFVGPRPLIRPHQEQFPKDLGEKRLTVKPGIVNIWKASRKRLTPTIAFEIEGSFVDMAEINYTRAQIYFGLKASYDIITFKQKLR